jgi:hypothetical protein
VGGRPFGALANESEFSLREAPMTKMTAGAIKQSKNCL